MAFGFISGTNTVFGLEINARTLLTPIVLALLASVIASTIPARKAAKLSPIEVIRNG
jgi:ABC-type lipoprotein release transport system permease subunit